MRTQEEAALSFASLHQYALLIASFYLPLQRVIELSKQFLPQTGVGFSSPKVHVHIQDGVEFMAQCKRKFDVIITDSSDAVGKQQE